MGAKTYRYKVLLGCIFFIILKEAATSFSVPNNNVAKATGNVSKYANIYKQPKNVYTEKGDKMKIPSTGSVKTVQDAGKDDEQNIEEILKKSLRHRGDARVKTIIRQVDLYKRRMGAARTSQQYNSYKRACERILGQYLIGHQNKQDIINSIVKYLPQMPKNLPTYSRYTRYPYSSTQEKAMFTEIKQELGQLKQELAKLIETGSKCDEIKTQKKTVTYYQI